MYSAHREVPRVDSPPDLDCVICVLALAREDEVQMLGCHDFEGLDLIPSL